MPRLYPGKAGRTSAELPWVVEDNSMAVAQQRARAWRRSARAALSAPRLARGASLIVTALRPQQWLKNLFVLAPLFFSAKLGDLHLLGRALLAAACFCGLSGAAYLINDICDRRRDAIHPLKRSRPVASGALSVEIAAGVAIVLAVGCLVFSAALGEAVLFLAGSYLVLILAYSFALKNIPIADIASIAAAFVLRAAAGAAAIAVPVSAWLFICTALVSLLLALGKRRWELLRLTTLAHEHRPVLRKYNQLFLDQLISITTTACLVSYLLYCVLSTTAAQHGGLLFTAPLVAYGLFRYLYFVYRKGKGGSPEDLFTDPVFLGNGVLYGISVVLVLYLT
jgi:4-hydroxybenzoate polyprenyltransferase